MGEIASFASQDEVGEQGKNLHRVDERSDDLKAGAGTQEAGLGPMDQYPGDRSLASTQQTGQVVNEQRQRDIKEVTVGLFGDVQTQRLHELSQDQGDGDLLQDERTDC